MMHHPADKPSHSKGAPKGSATSAVTKSAAKGAAPLAAQMARLLTKALSEAVAPLGIAPAQFLVLRELWKGDGLTQGELVRRLDVEQPTMANTLKRMQRDGLIDRQPLPGDSRSARIGLTERARDLEKPAKAAAKSVNALALSGLSRKEQKRFVDLSHRIIATLQAPPTSGSHPAAPEPEDN